MAMRVTVVGLAAASLWLIAGCGAVQLPAAAPSGTADPAGPTITVQGEARLPIPTSTATFTAGVQRQASSAADALAEDNAAAQQLIDALKKAGVPDKDLTTQQVAVQPQYAYGPNQPPRLTGYQAADTLQVKVDDASRVGPAIDAAAAGGATQIGSVSFGPPDGDTLEQQALAAAVDNARARAEAIAREAHLSLGAVREVTMQVSAPPVRMMGVTADAAAASVPTPVETGTQELDAQVEVTFAAD
jgi:uncharacterized protein YggE